MPPVHTSAVAICLVGKAAIRCLEIQEYVKLILSLIDRSLHLAVALGSTNTGG